MEVPAKEGSLYLQSVKFGKKNWKRIWMMLFQASSSGIGRVELCSMRDGGSGPSTVTLRQGLKKTDRTVIRLADCLSVTSAPEENCPLDCMAFYLNTTQRTYTLAAESSEDWVPKLCQLAFQQKNDDSQNWLTRSWSEDMPMAENELYSSLQIAKYKVTVQRTEAAIRCKLAGSYLLSLGQDAMSLLDPQSAQTIYSWPYRFLRRFGQDKEGVTIEAGRRCDSGEGHFTFLSKEGVQIYRAIEDAIIRQSLPTLEPRDTYKQSAAQGYSPSRRREPVDNLSSCPDITTPVVLPRNVFPPDLSRKLPLHQVSCPQTEPETVLYSTIQIPPAEKQLPAAPRRQQSPPTSSHWKNKEEWEEEDYEYELEDEDRLCSLDSICLDDIQEDVPEQKSPLYYNYKGCLDAKEESQHDSQSPEAMYSTVNCQPKPSKEQLNDDQSLLSHTPPIITSTERPADFKQKLSNILFKDLAKVQPQLAIRNIDAAKPPCDQYN
ncbi:docking protein 3 [Arapaima gigas]